MFLYHASTSQSNPLFGDLRSFLQKKPKTLEEAVTLKQLCKELLTKADSFVEMQHLLTGYVTPRVLEPFVAHSYKDFESFAYIVMDYYLEACMKFDKEGTLTPDRLKKHLPLSSFDLSKHSPLVKKGVVSTKSYKLTYLLGPDEDFYKACREAYNPKAKAFYRDAAYPTAIKIIVARQSELLLRALDVRSPTLIQASALRVVDRVIRPHLVSMSRVAPDIAYGLESLMHKQAKSSTPKTVKKYVDRFLDKGYDESYAYAMAWSIFCKHKYPNSDRCQKDSYLDKKD
jgi:hypothetical protein